MKFFSVSQRPPLINMFKVFRKRELLFEKKLFSCIASNTEFFLLQYMGSFPVAVPDIASRAEFVRSQLQILRVSALAPLRFCRILKTISNLASSPHENMIIIREMTNYACEVTLFSFRGGQNLLLPVMRGKTNYSSAPLRIIRSNKILG